MSLIKDIQQIRDAASINVTNTLNMWQPYLDDAEALFIAPVIGSDLYDALKNYSNTSTLPSKSEQDEKIEVLITMLRKPIALYALWLGVDEMAVSISGSGVQIAQTENMKPAAQYQIKNLKERWFFRANQNMDVVLAYLEKFRESYPLYVSADGSLFIRSTAQFQAEIDIKNSRRVFQSIVPTLKSIERKYILPTIGEDLYEELRDKITGSASTELSADDQTLIDLIRPAVVHLGMARALQDIGVEYLNWGTFTIGENTFDNLGGVQAFNQQRIDRMVEDCQRDGDAELKAVQEFLDNNASETKYASFFNSDLYVGPADAENKNRFENSADNRIFLA